MESEVSSVTCFVCGDDVPEEIATVEYLTEWESPEHICTKATCRIHVDVNRTQLQILQNLVDVVERRGAETTRNVEPDLHRVYTQARSALKDAGWS